MSRGCKVAGHQTLRMIRPWPNVLAQNLASMTEVADFFMRTLILTASSFEAL